MNTSTRRGLRVDLPLILVAAFVVRAALLVTPRTYHADEVFQHLEQAHRLVFGYGVVPWEYRYGIRSWLVPALLAGPMAIGALLAPSTSAYLLLPRLCLALLSVGSVAAAHSLGRRISPRHGQAAALAVAFWPEFALFAGQAMTDVMAVPLVLIAAAAMQERARWRIVLAGGLLALAVSIRFPYAPAIGVLAATTLRTDRAAWTWLTLGALVGLTLAAIPDIALSHAPYAWIAANWYQNIVAHHAQAYGTDGPFFYLIQLLATWAFWLFPALWLAWIGARHYPSLGIMAATNFLVMTVLAHKEYRFILLSVMTVIVLAALGSVDVVQRWQRPRLTRLLIVGWALAAATMLLMPGEMEDWDATVPGNRAFAVLGRDPNTCGIAMWGEWWTSAGGYTYLHRPVPIYLPDRMPNPREELFAHQAAYNTIVSPPRLATPPPPGYQRMACYGPLGLYSDAESCIWRRAGGCDSKGADAISINRIVGEPDQPDVYERWLANGVLDRQQP